MLLCKTWKFGFECNSVDFLILYQFETTFLDKPEIHKHILMKPSETKGNWNKV